MVLKRGLQATPEKDEGLRYSANERGQHGARTTMVKVHGHTGEPLHAVADAMATERADRKMEANE